MSIATCEIPMVAVVGVKGSGQTELVVALIQAFKQLGLEVATLKHSAHEHPVDQPDSASDRHRRAGATLSAFVTPFAGAIYWEGPRPDSWERILSCFSRASIDLVVIEGGTNLDVLKVEAYLGAPEPRPLCHQQPGIEYIWTDELGDYPAERFGSSQVSALALRIWERLK